MYKQAATTVALTTSSPSMHFYFFLLPDARRHTVHVYLFPLLSFALSRLCSCHESDYHQRTVGACITLYLVSLFLFLGQQRRRRRWEYTSISSSNGVVGRVGNSLAARYFSPSLVLSFCSSPTPSSRAEKKHTYTLNYHNYQFGSSPTGINDANSSDRRDIEQTARRRRRRGQCMWPVSVKNKGNEPRPELDNGYELSRVLAVRSIQAQYLTKKERERNFHSSCCLPMLTIRFNPFEQESSTLVCCFRPCIPSGGWREGNWIATDENRGGYWSWLLTGPKTKISSDDPVTTLMRRKWDKDRLKGPRENCRVFDQQQSSVELKRHFSWH